MSFLLNCQRNENVFDDVSSNFLLNETWAGKNYCLNLANAAAVSRSVLSSVVVVECCLLKRLRDSCIVQPRWNLASWTATTESAVAQYGRPARSTTPWPHIRQENIPQADILSSLQWYAMGTYTAGIYLRR